MNATRRNHDHLVTMNIGMGRDSIAMLCLLGERALVCGGSVMGPEDLDAAIFADTGEEWDHTYAVVPLVRELCDRIGVRLIVLEKPPERVWMRHLRARGSRETPGWIVAEEGQSIDRKAASGAYHRRLPIMDEFGRFAKIAVTVNSSCTSNHKVGPIRRCVNDLSVERFGMPCGAWSRRAKKGQAVRHEVLIGIAADEASRAIDTGRPFYEQVRYPLVEIGIDKDGTAPILERHGFGHVRKSGCIMCPYQGVGWYWALRETNPARWARVIDYEARALAENAKMFVAGRSGMPLPAAVDEWRRKNPDATIDAVLDKAYSRCRVVDKRQLDMFAPPAGDR